jgi:hypothetical protein
MLKKAVIIGLVLIVAGSSVLGYLLLVHRKEQQQSSTDKDKHASQLEGYLDRYNQWLNTPVEERTELPWGLDESGKTLSGAQLSIEQQGMLRADLEKLAAGEKEIHPFADQLYGKDWRVTLEQYKQQKELREIASVASAVCAATGGLVIACCLILMLVRCLLRKFSPAFETIARFYKNLFKREDEEIDDDTKEHDQEDQSLSIKRKKNKQDRIRKKRVKTLTDSGWYPLESDSQKESEQTCAEIVGQAETKYPEEALIESSNEDSTLVHQNLSTDIPRNFEDFSESNDKGFQEQQINSGQNVAASYGMEHDFRTSEWGNGDSSEKGQLSLSVKDAIEESPNEEISDTLKQLTRQVSAIREYASDQQAKFKKLQAGYDWKIIKSFSLRVIRCIDNLESRIDQLRDHGIDTVCLEEVRDELLFALESSGIEQFRPEIKSEYRGLEKTTEVVKEKEPAKKSKLKGRIAKVIRPGYQYYLNEDKVKVVRTAQVKLYG